MKQAKQSKPRNFVAKHARAGGGAHKDKVGPHASRARQKHNYTRNSEA